MHAPFLGQMNWLGTKVHEHNSVNVELQRKEMVTGFIDCDDTEYNGILDTLGAGIYIHARQQKNIFLRTDRGRFRTNSVRTLRPVIPDLPCLLAFHFLHLVHPDAPLSLHRVRRGSCGRTPSSCLPLVSAPLSSCLLASCLLLAVARIRRPSLLPLHLW